MNYFDNAATTYPKPQSVYHSIADAMKYYGANPGRSGHKMSMETAVQMYRTRELAAELFGAQEPEHVVFTQNCTHALNIAIKGILKPGDHVIVSDLEHNSVIRPIHRLSQKEMITYDVAQTHLDTEQTVQSFESLIRPDTKLMICTHASNVFGCIQPIKELAALCRQRRVLFLVDAAQTAGIVPINMNWGIDFLCTAGHKSLYGPSGTGLLVTPHGETLDTLVEGGTGSLSLVLDQPEFMPDRLESGTLNTSGIIGLGAGMRFVNKNGISRMYTEEMRMMQYLYTQLAQMKRVRLYMPYPKKELFVPVLSFTVEGQTGEQTALTLSNKGFALRGGFHCSPLAHRKMNTEQTGTARISIGAYNTVQQAVELAKEIGKL